MLQVLSQVDVVYLRIRQVLIGGAGLTILIDPNKAPLLHDVQELMKRMEAGEIPAAIRNRVVTSQTTTTSDNQNVIPSDVLAVGSDRA